MKEIYELFRQLSRTEKTKFISEKIEYASRLSVGRYIYFYFMDILPLLRLNDIVTYLRAHGYTVVEPKENGGQDE